VCVCVW